MKQDILFYQPFNRIIVTDLCSTFFAGLYIDEFSRAKMEATADELLEEKALAYSYSTYQ